MLQTHIEFGSDCDDLSRSGEHAKCALGVMGDFLVCLAGRDCDEPFRLASLGLFSLWNVRPIAHVSLRGDRQLTQQARDHAKADKQRDAAAAVR
jgi:hypothetical protein